MASTADFVNQQWDSSILPTLIEYIRIPNQSPAYDPDWQTNGHMQRAANLFLQWCQQHPLRDMQCKLHQFPGRTPLLMIEVPGQVDKTVLLYGHLDKQPPMTGWNEGLGPWHPVVKNQRLYGRGGADDGYAMFAAMTAIAALQQQDIPHARCVILIEACEESGSLDLPIYLEHLAGEMGTPDLVVCLDSGCGNYDQLWCTTSLRGQISAELNVSILTEGVHSGSASGIVPSSFRIIRQLLDRIEDVHSGIIRLPAMHVNIPSHRVEEAKQAAAILGDAVWQNFPWVNGAKPGLQDNVELILNRTWRPTLSITGVQGIPDTSKAGNVLRPNTCLTLSFRLPPTCDAAAASDALAAVLMEAPPYGAKVELAMKQICNGWNAPTLAPWLAQAVNQASLQHFAKPACYHGEGGAIPFMGMLGAQFPDAQFMITGVLGPHSNAHGPNEFLDIPTAKKVTACLAEVLATHFQEKIK